MKKIKLTVITLILSISLSANAIYLCIPVYALDDDGYYTLSDGTVIAEDEWDYWIKILMYYGCQLGAIGKSDYFKFMKNSAAFANWWNVNKSYWKNGETSEGVTISEKQSIELLEILRAYFDEQPDVEKINYQLFQTSNYEELFDNFIDIKNAFVEGISVSEDLNSIENFYTMWKGQNSYPEFPHLMSGMIFGTLVEVNKTPEGYINQNFTIYQNYESALTDSTKTPCFVGSISADGTYKLCIYVYDSQTKALTVDRSSTSTQQYHYAYNQDEMGVGFELTNTGKFLFSASAPAYVNVSDTYYNGWANLPDPVLHPELREKYMANFSGSIVKLPILGTPDSSVFRLFATEQDAMRYFEMCEESGLNFDPSQVYTGGSVTINNNGDVTINNPPSEGGDDTPVNDSEMLEMIYNRLGEILTQVGRINQISIADTVINAIDAYDGGISQIADELVDSISQVFPFCILWDFVRIVKIFEAEPISPVFEIPIKFVWIDEAITIDLTEYESLFTLLRTGEVILFLLGLFNITMAWVGKGDEVI